MPIQGGVRIHRRSNGYGCIGVKDLVLGWISRVLSGTVCPLAVSASLGPQRAKDSAADVCDRGRGGRRSVRTFVMAAAPRFYHLRQTDGQGVGGLSVAGRPVGGESDQAGRFGLKTRKARPGKSKVGA